MGRAALPSFVCCCGFAVRIVWWSSVFALSSNVLTNVLMFMSLKYYGILVWYHTGFQAPRVIAASVCQSFWRSNLLCKRSSKRSLLMILDCFVMCRLRMCASLLHSYDISDGIFFFYPRVDLPAPIPDG